MLFRTLTETLRKNLQRMPAVALLGPRQAGKTTLAKAFSKQEKNSLYLDLEDPEDLQKLQEPKSFLLAHSDKLVILDEIQRAPELFPTLRGLIDRSIERGRKAGQFLLLGSASMKLLRQSSESLAGRISHLELSGLNTLEVEPEEQKTLWLRGGFPDSFTAQNDADAMDWLESFVRTYLERDVPQAGFRVPAERLRRLWTMLAHLQGEPINRSHLGASLEIDGKTVSHYMDILVDLLLVRRLEPWYLNAKKRLVKSPRYYIRDSGVQHRLLSIPHHDALLSHPALGKSWEGFVVENIHAVLPNRAQTYFYRTNAGAEIDLVIKMSSSEIWAVEIKHGVAPKISRHFSRTCDDLGATRKYVVYGGEDEFPIGDDVTMISLRRFMEKLRGG